VVVMFSGVGFLFHQPKGKEWEGGEGEGKWEVYRKKQGGSEMPDFCLKISPFYNFTIEQGLGVLRQRRDGNGKNRTWGHACT